MKVSTFYTQRAESECLNPAGNVRELLDGDHEDHALILTLGWVVGFKWHSC